ncbi:MAG: recombinase family protein [[Clostridium] innocuum]
MLYIDEGHSASTLERPSIKQMLQDVRDRKSMRSSFKLDRLTRNVIVHMNPEYVYKM